MAEKERFFPATGPPEDPEVALKPVGNRLEVVGYR